MITLKILDPVHVETNKEGKVNLNECLSYENFTWTRPKNKNKKKRRIDYSVYLIQPTFDHKWIFPTGLLPRALDFLDELNLPYQLTGTLGTVKFDKPGIKGVTFRPDQKRLIKAALVNGRGVLQAPTGSGKTICLLGIISAFKEEQILFLCHTLSLVSQFKEELIKWGFSDIGILSGEEKSFGRIQLATIQSFFRLDPRTYVNKYDVIFVDECFHKSTRIKTVSGDQPIEKIKVGDHVQTSSGPKKVKHTFKTEVKLKDVVRIKLSTGKSVFCSKNHLFKTPEGWAQAQNLQGEQLTSF